MSKAELQAARARLEQIRAEILSRGNERPVVERSAETMETAVAQYNANRVSDDRKRDARQLQQIIVALDAINHDEYGTCSECEAAIPARRLLLVPWATMCVPCAERLENVEKQRDAEEAADQRRMPFNCFHRGDF